MANFFAAWCQIYIKGFADQTCCQPAVSAAPVASLMRYLVVHMLQTSSILSLPVSVCEMFLNFDFMYFTVQNNLQDNTTLCFLVAVFLSVIYLTPRYSGRTQKVTSKMYIMTRNNGLVAPEVNFDKCIHRCLPISPWVPYLAPAPTVRHAWYQAHHFVSHVFHTLVSIFSIPLLRCYLAQIYILLIL